jgi:hypothetical protein
MLHSLIITYGFSLISATVFTWVVQAKRFDSTGRLLALAVATSWDSSCVNEIGTGTLHSGTKVVFITYPLRGKSSALAWTWAQLRCFSGNITPAVLNKLSGNVVITLPVSYC